MVLMEMQLVGVSGINSSSLSTVLELSLLSTTGSLAVTSTEDDSTASGEETGRVSVSSPRESDVAPTSIVQLWWGMRFISSEVGDEK